MSDKTYIDPHQDTLDDFVETEDDQSTSETGHLSSVHSQSRTRTADLNVTSEHHHSPTVSSEDFGLKRKHEMTDAGSMKKFHFFGEKQPQGIHFSTSETSSNVAASAIPTSLPVSVIRHTRDELLHVSDPPENTNTTPISVNKSLDNVQTDNSADASFSGHVAGPSHFICDVCGKCFFFKSQLDQHRAIHNTEKPFSCEICKEKFSLKGNLNRHLLTHSEQKVHECDQCPKVYTRKGNLERHYRIHTGEKPFVCEKCGKRYSDLSPFIMHHLECKSPSKAD